MAGEGFDDLGAGPLGRVDHTPVIESGRPKLRKALVAGACVLVAVAAGSFAFGRDDGGSEGQEALPNPDVPEALEKCGPVEYEDPEAVTETGAWELDFSTMPDGTPLVPHPT